MATRMQAATNSGRFVLLRYDAQTGHGSSTVQDGIAQLTDELSFLFSELAVVLPDGSRSR
jgi:hypothetical protein